MSWEKLAPQVWRRGWSSCVPMVERTGDRRIWADSHGHCHPRSHLRGSLALVVAVRRAALPREAMAGARPPECMHLGGLCVTAAGGTVTEAGEGRPDFHALCCDRALDSLPELEG